MRKQGIWVTRFTLLILFTFVVVFMGYHVIDAFSGQMETVSAVLTSLEESVQANGVFVRYEKTLPMPSGIVEYLVQEGARVANGEALAVVYHDAGIGRAYEELKTLDAQIGHLERTRLQSVSLTNPGALDSAISENIVAILDALHKGALSTVRDKDAHLRSLMYKRASVFEGGENLDAVINRLTRERAEIEESVAQDVSAVETDQSGTFSFYVDGYEEWLTPDMLDTATVSSLTLQMTRAPAAVSSASFLGKMVSGFTWRYAAVMPVKDVAAWSEGMAVEMTVGNSDGFVTAARVRRISEEEKGLCVVVLEGDRDMQKIASLRRRAIRIRQESYSGVRIPRASTRMDENGEAGVYCLVLNQVRFKKVEILTERDNYYIAAYTPEKSNALLPGDEIIVGGRDLYDGKILKDKETW